MSAAEPTDAPAPTAALLSMLTPVAERVAALRPSEARDDEATKAMTAALAAEFPFDGEFVRGIEREIRRGVAQGWLCDRGEPSARFCRLAKPSEATAGLSIDLVALEGPARAHGHPKGEVTMAFTADATAGDDARFDGHAAGWVVMAAGSTHVPTVTGPRMHLLYFLPDGAVDWKPQ